MYKRIKRNEERKKEKKSIKMQNKLLLIDLKGMFH